MMIRVSADRSVAQRESMTFGRWVQDGHALGWPTADDISHHLTTLFPPVRPRGWLELRMIDALPEEWWPVAVAVTTALLDDPEAVARARRATAPVRDHWRAASRDALTDRGLRDAAFECFEAALDALDRMRVDPETRRRDVGVLRALRHAGPLSGRRPARRVVGAADRTRLNVVTKPEIVASLDEARRRTLGVLAPIPDAAQRAQVSELMSPLCWDLAHIGHFEELWLVRELTGAPPSVELYDDVYDAFRHARRDRPSLPMLDPAGARAFDADVRARALAVLDRTVLDPEDPLLRDGFVHGMVVQHEHQHDETLLATIQLMEDYAHPDADGAGAQGVGAGDAPAAADVLVPGGTFTMGTDTTPWAYDNERPAHGVTVDAVPDRHDAGHQPRVRRVRGSGWLRRSRALERRRMDVADRSRPARATVLAAVGRRILDASTVRARRAAPRPRSRCSTCAGTKRTPTRAGRGHGSPPRPSGSAPRSGRRWSRRTSGTRARTASAPAPVGSRAGDASRWGVEGMLGDVWEWTASDFLPYPGFRPFPYREYSEVFFGSDYKVLRGGSWATHPSAVAHHVPQLGLSRSAARSSPGSVARATHDRPDVSPPRVRRTTHRHRRACCSTRRTRSRARPSTRASRRRAPPIRTGGVLPGTSPTAAEPQRYRTVTPIWDDHEFAARAPVDHERRVRRRRPARVARGHARRHRQRAVRLRSLVVLVQRHRRRLPRRHRRRAPHARRAAAGRRHRRRRRHRGALRAGAPDARRRRRPAKPLAASCTRSWRSPPVGSTCSSPTAHDLSPRGTATRSGAAARCWPPSPSTTSRAGRKSRTGRSSPSPPTAAPRDHCDSKGSTPMTGDVTVDVHLEPDATARALEADVRAGLGAHPQDAAAEVVLRRSRQRALRRDHPPPRVLPDPHRARHPRRARPRRRRAHQGRHARRARLGHVGEDAAPPRRAPRAGTLERFVPFDVSEQTLRDAAAAVAREYDGVRSTRSSATSNTTSTSSPTAGRGWSRSSAARSATSRRSHGSEFLADVAAALAPGDALLLGTDLVKDPGRLVAAYDDAAGVTAEFNRNVLRVAQPRARRRLRPGGVRARRSLRSRSRVDRDAAALERCADRHHRRPRPRPSTSPTVKSCAPRSAPSSAGSGSSASFAPPGSSSRNGGPIPTGTSRSRSPSPADPSLGSRCLTSR